MQLIFSDHLLIFLDFPLNSNLISLLVLQGKEPGWICFAICNSDSKLSGLSSDFFENHVVRVG
jgi:hypothetical protein